MPCWEHTFEAFVQLCTHSSIAMSSSRGLARFLPAAFEDTGTISWRSGVALDGQSGWVSGWICLSRSNFCRCSFITPNLLMERCQVSSTKSRGGAQVVVGAVVVVASVRRGCEGLPRKVGTQPYPRAHEPTHTQRARTSDHVGTIAAVGTG